jgi:hypothetical protein
VILNFFCNIPPPSSKRNPGNGIDYLTRENKKSTLARAGCNGTLITFITPLFLGKTLFLGLE